MTSRTASLLPQCLAGYEVILRIGEQEENLIGSNCGQYIQTMLKHEKKHVGSYCYPLQDLVE